MQSTVVLPTSNAKPEPINGAPEPESVEIQDWLPSQFNARTTAPDGTLVLWNSYSNAFSGFPPQAIAQVEPLLTRKGFRGPKSGLTKYMAERGFIVPKGANEFERFQFRFGKRHYRQDVLELTILASEQCNFRCVYCYEEFVRGTMEPWVRAAVVQMVEKHIAHLKTVILSYFGGEPLMGFEAIEDLGPALLQLAEKHGVNLMSGMTTNGYLLSEDVAAKLLAWKINHFQITLDGAPEDHDSRRMLIGGGPTFHRILDNLKNLQKFKDEFEVVLRVNFDPASAKRMREFMQMISPFKGDSRFHLFFYPIRHLGGPNDRSLKICDETDSQRTELETLGAQTGVQTKRTAPAQRPFGEPCYANRPHHFVVGTDGSLMKCTVMLSSRKRNIVGRLRPDGSMDIDIDRFTAWCKPHYANDPACAKCFFLPICAGGICPVTRVVQNKRHCPPDRLRIGAELRKLWAVNHAGANRYDLRREQLFRAGEVENSKLIVQPEAEAAAESALP
jgi:uncharacterized protein